MENSENRRIVKELCESNDQWIFKDFILVMLFYRFLSEDFTQYINAGEIEAGELDFDYASLADDEAESVRDEMTDTKGFFLLPSQLFCNVLKNAITDENLNETLETIFRSINESAAGHSSASGFDGLFDNFDVNSKELGKTVAERNQRIVSLMNGITRLQFTLDNCGDVYEDLIGMFASEAGKTGGKFYTPSHVSELLVRLALLKKPKMIRVYDPACGSGSLMLKCTQILGKDNVRGFYGQDIEPSVYNLCRINMFLHGIDPDKFDIERENTLENPQHSNEQPFDIIVSNPQFDKEVKWSGKKNPLLINDPRFSPAGVLAPPSHSYWAFVMHSLSMLETNGTAVLICDPGALYRDKAEAKIRKYLIDNNYADCIIQLSNNLFFKDKSKGQSTSIAVCVIILKKNKEQNSTLFIDASKEFEKVKRGNILTEENIAKIVTAYSEKTDQTEFCRLVQNSEIVEKDYNLSVSQYVVSISKRETIDISKLNEETAHIIGRVNDLNAEIDRIIAEIEAINS